MQKKIELKKSKLLLEEIGTMSSTIVLFLPGISGKAFSERFQQLVSVSLELGLPIVRMNAWEGEEDVNEHTWMYYQEALDEAVEYLINNGYSRIVGIGKSFGGGQFLTFHHENIVKKILWAPAIGIGNIDTFEKWKNSILKEIPSLLGIQVSKEFVHSDPAVMCIIHGTKDDVIPLENSRTIIASLDKGMLLEIDGADHSFKSSEQEIELLEATKKCLQY